MHAHELQWDSSVGGTERSLRMWRDDCQGGGSAGEALKGETGDPGEWRVNVNPVLGGSLTKLPKGTKISTV